MRTPVDTQRLFIAFPLPPEVQQHLREVHVFLERHAPSDAFRMIDPRNTHITLHFLGEIPTVDIPAIIAGIRSSAAADRSRIRCQLGGLGYFPGIRKPRVVWIGLNELRSGTSPDLSARGRAHFTRIEQELTTAGIHSTSTRYTPHITLGYKHRSTRQAEAVNTASAWEQQFRTQGLVFSLDSISLFASIPTAQGRRHQTLHTEPLHD